MNGISIAKAPGAVVAGAIGLLFATSWHDSPWSGRGCSGDCMVVLSVPEYILKLSVALLALVFVALVVTRHARRRRVLAGAAACAASGATMVLMTMGLYALMADRYFGPDPSVIIFVSAITGLIGLLVSWCLARWWPNNSLERTRER